jgi:hypothetical protein
VVAAIRKVEISRRIERDARGEREFGLERGASFGRESRMPVARQRGDGTIVSDLANALAAEFGYIEITCCIDRHIAWRQKFVRARDRADDAVRSHFTYAIVPKIRDIQVACAIHSDSIRCVQTRGRRRPPIPTESSRPVAGHRRDRAIRSDLAHTMVIGIGDKQVACTVERHTFGITESRRAGQASIAHRTTAGHGLNGVGHPGWRACQGLNRAPQGQRETADLHLVLKGECLRVKEILISADGPAMKHLRCLALFLIGISTLEAQVIHLKTRDIEPISDIRGYLGHPLKRRVPGRSHYLVQFEGQIRPENLEALRARGMRVTGWLPKSAVMVAASDEASFDGLPVRWIGRLEDRDKISPLLAAGSHSLGSRHTVVVEFHADVDMHDARNMVVEHNLKIVENPDLAQQQLLVRGAFGDFIRLATWDEVAYIFPASRELATGVHVRACAGPVVLETTVAQYATSAMPWPVNGAGGLTLGYAFARLTDKLPVSTTKSEILRAFNEWAKYANITFVPGSDPQALRTVSILFASGAHGDAYPFDGPGRVLAHTFYPAPPNPEPIAGDMHLDNDERWQVGANIDLFSVVIHEAGHALGLTHTDQPASVMYPYYRFGIHLGSEDVATIQALYGARDGAPVPPAPPAPAPPPPPLPLALTIQNPPTAIVITTASSISMSGVTSGGTGTAQVSWQTDHATTGLAAGSASWAIGSISLNLGANTVTVVARDTAGNIASRSISVTRQEPQTAAQPAPAPVAPNPPPSPQPPPSPSPQAPTTPGDSTPPSLRITYPPATIFSTSSDTITFKGTASDNVGVTSVAWASLAGYAGTATGTNTWTTAPIPLLKGNNTIIIRAFDAAGNNSWRSVTVVR